MVRKLSPLPLTMSLLLFGIPTLLLLTATYIVMPFLNSHGVIPVISWFISGGVMVFAPLFSAALAAHHMEGGEWSRTAIFARLRIHTMDRGDWLWAVTGLIAVFAVTGALMALSAWLSSMTDMVSPIETDPPFLAFHGLEPGQGWILGIWIVFFFFNIVGEEIWWRGYILPRQELRHGRTAWIINGLLWSCFHLAFGPDLMVLLMPIMFIEPYIVQKRQNTLIGIFIHGMYNGPLFVAIALNLL